MLSFLNKIKFKTARCLNLIGEANVLHLVGFIQLFEILFFENGGFKKCDIKLWSSKEAKSLINDVKKFFLKKLNV